jgi:hypothetical protein
MNNMHTCHRRDQGASAAAWCDALGGTSAAASAVLPLQLGLTTWHYNPALQLGITTRPYNLALQLGLSGSKLF